MRMSVSMRHNVEYCEWVACSHVYNRLFVSHVCRRGCVWLTVASVTEFQMTKMMLTMIQMVMKCEKRECSTIFCMVDFFFFRRMSRRRFFFAM